MKVLAGIVLVVAVFATAAEGRTFDFKIAVSVKIRTLGPTTFHAIDSNGDITVVETSGGCPHYVWNRPGVIGKEGLTLWLLILDTPGPPLRDPYVCQIATLTGPLQNVFR